MGFGFNLFIIFFITPLTGILLVVWLLTRNSNFGKVLAFIWLAILMLVLLLSLIKLFTSKKELEKSDYYGEYIIKREFFKGKQSNWQYNHFRFEIKENDSIYFYVTDKEKILETFRGSINTTDPKTYISERLIIEIEEPIHHILTSNPTTFRETWDFYLVFNSPKFSNVFFEKGKWKPID